MGFLYLDACSNVCSAAEVYDTLLPNSGFVLDEMFQPNASKFAIFYIYEKPKLLFPFFISCYFFPLMNVGRHRVIRETNKVARNEKRKKQLWVFGYIKYGKF